MTALNPLSEFYLDSQFLNDSQNRPELLLDNTAQCIGKAVHCLLQLLLEKNALEEGGAVKYWQAFSMESRRQWLQALLHSFGLSSHGIQNKQGLAAVNEVDAAISRVLADKRGSWILSAEHRQSRAEFELFSRSSGRIAKRIIDRCFIDCHGDAWIIDYKTAKPLAEESRQDFVERELEQHREQLEDYREMLAQHSDYADAANIRLALYFTHYPIFHEF
jgi:ATP-dependent exoDNAse (exonuclease V) beta subunit